VIQLVRIKNFRALKDVEVELRPMTVLLGPNDSGKSSFLDAVLKGLKHEPIKAEDFWRGEEKADIEVLRSPNNTFEGSVEIFRLPSNGIAMESVGAPEPPKAGAPKAPQLHESGANLAALLDYLLRKDRKRFDSIQQTLKDRVPGLEEIRIGTPSVDRRAVLVSIENGFEILGQRISIGVRILLFFITLAHHPTPPDVVLIEEPETGVHPKRLKDIVGLLRDLTAGKLGGKRVQVIMSTHSPYLLDQIHLPQDQVLVFQRETDGSRSVKAADEKHLKTFLDEFMLGEVWFNQGEEGLVAAQQ
jgi:predicted ATPase